jgi:hypothetical protein
MSLNVKLWQWDEAGKHLAWNDTAYASRCYPLTGR